MTATGLVRRPGAFATAGVLRTVDHKDIGILYIITSLFLFAAAGVLAITTVVIFTLTLGMRFVVELLQRLQPAFAPPALYNVLELGHRWGTALRVPASFSPTR